MASQDIGKLGPSDGQPILFNWRWYYSFPDLPMWALIFALLVAPKSNRAKQAWFILIPLLLLVGVWQLPAMSIFMNPSGAEGFGFLVGSGAFGWSVILLIRHWLGNINRFFTFFLFVGVMLAAFALSYLCQFNDAENAGAMSILYAAFTTVVVLAMSISGFMCRKKYAPWRFLIWLLIWMGVLSTVLMLAYVILLTTLEKAFSGEDLIILIPVAAILGSMLYALNLPFLILAFNSPFYRERFVKVFDVGRLQNGVGNANAVESAGGKLPG